jgi:hypothetical protein
MFISIWDFLRFIRFIVISRLLYPRNPANSSFGKEIQCPSIPMIAWNVAKIYDIKTETFEGQMRSKACLLSAWCL